MSVFGTGDGVGVAEAGVGVGDVHPATSNAVISTRVVIARKFRAFA
jgi:hypothetical protein